MKSFWEKLLLYLLGASWLPLGGCRTNFLRWNHNVMYTFTNLHCTCCQLYNVYIYQVLPSEELGRNGWREEGRNHRHWRTWPDGGGLVQLDLIIGCWFVGKLASLLMLNHKNLTFDGLPQVRLAKAMGNSVTAISTSPSKEAAAREIGADKWDQQG